MNVKLMVIPVMLFEGIGMILIFGFGVNHRWARVWGLRSYIVGVIALIIGIALKARYGHDN